ncbi:MAG: hypothetical protein KGI45_04235 [Patescibacteria group bacterium]|nr:hypothetical protein [Patescibacteria group bacterium]
MNDRRHPERYLKRMRFFLELIGDPHRGMKFIHITGTAGKGTVTNLVHEMLYASGRNVGSFTSPFVTTYIEKIRVGNRFIPPDEFAEIVEYLKPYIDHADKSCRFGRPSYFEALLAIGFIYFRRRKCDIIVLEAGCGGRFDATNVIEDPLITAITNIDYDHTDIFGKNLKNIAFEKAGIIKKGSHFFTSEKRKNLLEIFKSECRKTGANWTILPKTDDYMETNFILASTIAKTLGVSERQIAKGAKTHRLPCRFEKMQDSPTVILDGAHNRIKMRSTAENLRKMRFKRSHLVIAISANKDKRAILREIIPFTDHAYFTRFQVKERRCSHPAELIKASRPFLKPKASIETYLDPNRALGSALKKASSKDLVLVTGSFYLAGELRRIWVSEDRILRRRRL